MMWKEEALTWKAVTRRGVVEGTAEQVIGTGARPVRYRSDDAVLASLYQHGE